LPRLPATESNSFTLLKHPHSLKALLSPVSCALKKRFSAKISRLKKPLSGVAP